MSKKLLALLLACAMLLSLAAVSAFADAEEAEESEEVEELSDDIYDFQLKLDGEIYTFPMSFAELVDMGWTYKGDETDTLTPYQYTVAETFKKDDLQIYASLYNMGINTVTFAEATVGGISIDSYQMKDVSNTVIEFPCGIIYGVSTLEDIQAAYGTPSDSYEGSMYMKLTYKYASYQEWNFYVYNETGTLDQFEVRNFVEDEEANAAAAAEVTDEPTEEVLSYVAPEELGDDPLSFVVEYAGDLYRLPAPVSAFLENGWTLKSGYEGNVYAGKDYNVISLMKDNQELRAWIRNYSLNATVTENCFVTEIEGDVNGTNLPITIPTGVTLGMSNDDVLAALEGVDYEMDDSSSYYIYYTIAVPDTYGEDIEIRVSLETMTVAAIEVSYDPRTLPWAE